MKKIVLLLLSILLVCLLASCDGKYGYDHLEFYPQDDGNYHVGLKENVDRESITEIDIPMFYKFRLVDGIAPEGFAKCTNLKKIELPFHVREINDYAFMKCGVELFTVPKHVKKIGDHAFYYCASLAEVSFEGREVELGEECFANCAKLEMIDLPRKTEEIPIRAFANCTSLKQITMPKKLLAINNMAFQGCSSLDGVELNDGLLYIGVNAFSDCASLGEISVPKSVISIGNGAFGGCENLTHAHFDGPETILPDYVKDMKNLTHLSFGDGVKKICGNSFEGARKLQSVTLSDSIEYLSAIFTGNSDEIFTVYGNCKYLGNKKNPYLYCAGVVDETASEYVIHPDTKHVSLNPFYRCKSLSTLALPNGIKSVSLFYGISGDNPILNACCEYNGIYYLSTKSNPYHIVFSLTDSSATEADIHPDTEIITNAFFLHNAENLTSLHIPAKVSSMVDFCMVGTPESLTSYSVDSGNKHFAAKDGVLYSKNGKQLISYPSKHSVECFVIPDEVREICYNAFKRSSITEVTFGKNVEIVNVNAFSSCEALERITINTKIDIIGISFVDYYPDEIIYSGNKEQWERILFLGDSYYLEKSIVFQDD